MIAIMPCRGRHDQTLAVLNRLRRAAGATVDFVAVTDNDAELATRLRTAEVPVIESPTRIGYWGCLRLATSHTKDHFIVNLANDLLPGRRWAVRIVEAYESAFGVGDGMVGFNDGINEGQRAAHFLISRMLLYRWYGEQWWPPYHHNYGDTEMCLRATEENRLVIAPWAILYHNHPLTGRSSDPVYEEGNATWNADMATFERRSRNQWRS